MALHLAADGIHFTDFSHGTTMVNELLDDYEEGTFIVAMAASSSGTISINNNYKTCDYNKTGRLCYVGGHVRSSGSPNGSGELNITGMPFTHYSAVSDRVTFATWYYGMTAGNPHMTAGDQPICYMSSGATYIRWQRGRAGIMNADMAAGMGGSTEVNFAGSYTVAT